MSYFLFGFLDLDDGPMEATALARVRVLAEHSAGTAGFCAKLSDPAEQSLLGKMRGPYSPENSLPFFLTKTPVEDTSESLLAPSPNGIRDSVPSVVAVGDWISGIFAAKQGVKRVRIWFADGFDVDFEQHTSSADQLARIYERRLLEAKDIPAMLFTIHS